MRKAEADQLELSLAERAAEIRVEVIILPVEEERPRAEMLPEMDARFADFIQQKPHLTEADRQLLTQRSNPLAGTVRAYAAPFDPAVPPEDWASNQ